MRALAMKYEYTSAHQYVRIRYSFSLLVARASRIFISRLASQLAASLQYQNLLRGQNFKLTPQVRTWLRDTMPQVRAWLRDTTPPQRWFTRMDGH